MPARRSYVRRWEVRSGLSGWLGNSPRWRINSKWDHKIGLLLTFRGALILFSELSEWYYEHNRIAAFVGPQPELNHIKLLWQLLKLISFHWTFSPDCQLGQASVNPKWSNVLVPYPSVTLVKWITVVVIQFATTFNPFVSLPLEASWGLLPAPP